MRYIFIATAITFLFVTCLINSSYGRVFKAIREDEIAAEAMGVGLFKHKCMAFMLVHSLQALVAACTQPCLVLLTPKLLVYFDL